MAKVQHVSLPRLAGAFERHVELVEQQLEAIAWQPGDKQSLRDYLKIARFFAEDLRARPADSHPAPSRNGNGRASKPAAKKAAKPAAKRAAKPAPAKAKSNGKPATKGGARKLVKPPTATTSKPRTVKVPA